MRKAALSYISAPSCQYIIEHLQIIPTWWSRYWRADTVRSWYVWYLAHVTGWERYMYTLHDLGHVSRVGSVLYRSCPTSHNSRLGSIGSICRWPICRWSIWGWYICRWYICRLYICRLSICRWFICRWYICNDLSVDDLSVHDLSDMCNPRWASTLQYESWTDFPVKVKATLYHHSLPKKKTGRFDLQYTLRATEYRNGKIR